MVYRFALPDLGEGVAEGEILTWYVAVGDDIAVDAPLLEVETDKATVEIPSPVAGTVRSLGADEGATVAVGDTLIEFEVAGDKGSGDDGGSGTNADAATERTLASAGDAGPDTTSRTVAASVVALPAVRALAKELGVALPAVRGTGKQGRITEADVRAAAAGVPDTDTGTGAANSQTPSTRRTIARRLTKAAAVPTVTNVDACDFEAVFAAGVSPLLAFARATVMALGEHPDLNALAPDGPPLQRQSSVHLGVATQSSRGLVVPVVRDADRLDLDELGRAITERTTAAREGQAAPADLQGSTFTITSAGKLAGLFSTPLLNLPEVAILGLYRIEPRAVVRDGEVVVRRTGNLSITFNHQVLDGMDAAAFLASVTDVLESWSGD
jgi:pyruvate/2-oxoglutarate dehydrogenase complex dihydrolipoamide acyltransferase (E2) component